MESVAVKHEFKDGDVVYFLSDQAQKYPLTVCERAKSDPNEIRCNRQMASGKVLAETFWPEHLVKREKRKPASERLCRPR